MELIEELNRNQNLVLALEEGVYHDSVLHINKVLEKNFKKIAYVTLLKPAATILQNFRDAGIDTERYCFIDCITEKSTVMHDTKDYVYIPEPTALTKLSIEIFGFLDEKKVDAIFFDSISSLRIYNSELIVVKFMHNLMNKVNASKAKGIYLVLKKDLERPLMRDMELFADRIITYSDLE